MSKKCLVIVNVCFIKCNIDVLKEIAKNVDIEKIVCEGVDFSAISQT